MNIESIMTKKVITVNMDITLMVICRIFEKEKFHHLLVMEDNILFGVISDRDVLKALSPFLNTLAEQVRDLLTLKKKAHQIMNRNPITITKEASLENAAQLMLKNTISCLPVVSPDGHVEGIITWKDLLKVYPRLIEVGISN